MAEEAFINYLRELGEKVQNGEIDLDDPESLVISLDGGYTIYDDNRNVLLDVVAEGDDDTLVALGGDGEFEHSFSMGGKELWSEEEVELWDALQAVRASLY